MSDKAEILDKGVKAALELAAIEGWPAVTLAAIADRAGLALSDFHGGADKLAIGHATEAHFDRAMSQDSAVLDGTPRERLFDVLMMRFEAMEPYRGGLLSFWKWRERHPAELVRMLADRQATARWGLVCAGLDGSENVPTGLKGVNLAWVVAKASRAWRRDSAPDFAKTMSVLDKQLRAAEEREDWLGRVIGGKQKRRDETSSEGGATGESDRPQPEAAA